MIALDTNILTRVFVTPADDAETRQQALSVGILSNGDLLYVPSSVALEFAWVLANIYDVDAAGIRSAFRHIASLGNVTLEHETALLEAADLHVRGLDFADALHLATAVGCSELATFDRRFAKAAGRLKLSLKVSTPAA